MDKLSLEQRHKNMAPAILQNLKRLQRVKSKLFSLKPFNLS